MVCQNPETVLVVSERPTMALSSHGLSWRVFLLSLLFRIFIPSREKRNPESQVLNMQVPSLRVLGLFSPAAPLLKVTSASL